METYSSRDIDVLSEQHALGLNDEEVDQLVDVTNHGVEGFPRHSVVLARADLGREAVVQEGLPGELGGECDAEDHPGELEAPAHNIKVPNREDERHDGGIGNGRGTWFQSVRGSGLSRLTLDHIRGLFHDSSSRKKEW